MVYANSDVCHSKKYFKKYFKKKLPKSKILLKKKV